MPTTGGRPGPWTSTSTPCRSTTGGRTRPARSSVCSGSVVSVASAAASGYGAGVSNVKSNGFLDFPVSGNITSSYGPRRHPIFGYRSIHDGIDFGDSCGAPIYATAKGVVVETYFQKAWGNRIIVDHGLHKGVSVATISNHLSGYAVQAGDHVKRGQIIGFVGNTGWSTGCHLHFTVLINGGHVDPMGWL